MIFHFTMSRSSRRGRNDNIYGGLGNNNNPQIIKKNKAGSAHYSTILNGLNKELEGNIVDIGELSSADQMKTT